jgi:hypothetical protein
MGLYRDASNNFGIRNDCAANQIVKFVSSQWVCADDNAGGISWPLLAPDGTAVAPSYSFSSATNMGMYRDTANNRLSFATGGVERLTIDASGRVGIGAPAPTGTASTKLYLYNTTEQKALNINSATTGLSTNYATNISASGGTTYNYALYGFATGGIMSMGFYGGGTGATSSNYGLYSVAYGPVGLAGVTNYGMRSIATTPAGDNSAVTNYGIWTSATCSNPPCNATLWGLWVDSGNAYFNGNVGIGTTAPDYKLDISGDVRWTGTLQGGSIPWARLTNFPSACPAGQYVSGIGGTLTCGSPSSAAQPAIYQCISPNSLVQLPGTKQLLFTCNPPNPLLLLYARIYVQTAGDDKIHVQMRVVYTDGTFTDFPEEVWNMSLGACNITTGVIKEYTILDLLSRLSQGEVIDRVEFYGYRIGTCINWFGNSGVYGYTF